MVIFIRKSIGITIGVFKENDIMKKEMNLLVSLDKNYIRQLEVMLTSLYLNNPGTTCHIFLMHRNMPETILTHLSEKIKQFQYELHPVFVDESLFRNAPTMKQYPQEMYYRLLAGQLLPDNIDRILYLDPDTLIINSLQTLWEMDVEQYLFAAAAHTGKTELANNVNRLRLGTNNDYYNSGVLLINLDRCRKEIQPADIFRFVENHAPELLLPDQDILNALYSDRILPVDDTLWNYDARNYNNYFVRSFGTADLRWVMEHTSILHFCGKEKPWKPNYHRRFGVLYLHYMQLSKNYLGENTTIQS